MNTFSYDPSQRAFIRDDDKEVMATLADDNKTLEWTHNTREANYGKEIEALLQSLDFENSKHVPDPEGSGAMVLKESPTPAPKKRERRRIKYTGPARHPQFGNYSDVHLLHDYNTMEDGPFVAKWGGPMTLSAVRLSRASLIISNDTADDIDDRLS